MTSAASPYQLYGDLASWWPLISPTHEYAEEAAFVASVLASGASEMHEVLELGSGGGSNAAHLKDRFTMTLVDLSDAMLDVSRALNPECDHVVGDMRSIRLGRTFDAVFVHDAIDYMTTEDDLAQAIETAAVHCRAGGVAVFVPDFTAETFEEGTEDGGSDAPDGAGARFFVWSWDPDPDDACVLSEYVFLLRDSAGAVNVVHETHRVGAFSREVWLRLLTEAGFDAVRLSEQTGDDRTPRDVFVARLPST